jgi:hypothetical protein
MAQLRWAWQLDERQNFVWFGSPWQWKLKCGVGL